ncbi:ankyrin repeat-containing domain protein [Thelonectria olida]|uniref:Ankyrin repeat-containing domain protein n=1 Tax=Thelonectria olida TaxID=1576542 RepID=A0A9P8VVH9_9HYPO|nr:ankyrin repeat-containing domain protein [Thelonectria olida]
MSARATPISDEAWELWKPTILRLLLSDGCSRSELPSRMKELGFEASKHQYEHKLKQWGLRKNLSGHVWKYIDHEIKKRKRDGKEETDVVLSGIRLPKTKVEKECQRYSFISTLDKLHRAPSPEEPDGMALYVCTPPRLPLEFSWPQDLPWLQFQSKYLQNRLSISFLPRSLSASPSMRNEFIGHAALILQVPHTSLFHLPRVMENKSVSRLAATIGRVMPEAFPGENFSRANALLNGKETEMVNVVANMLLYGISNNHMNDVYALEQVASVLQSFNLLPVQWKKILQSVDSLTGLVLRDKIFETAVVSNSVKLAKTLLSLGADPNQSFAKFSPQTYDNTQETPISFAASLHNLEMVEVLAKAGACLGFEANVSPMAVASRACHYLHEKWCPESEACLIVQFMLSYGAPVNPPNGRMSALGAAAFNGDLPLVKYLVEQGADIRHWSPKSVATHGSGYTWSGPHPSYYEPEVTASRLLSRLTPLVCAALGTHSAKRVNMKGKEARLNEMREREYETVFHFLLSLEPSTDPINPDVLISAARCGLTDYIKALFDRGVDMNAENSMGISALLSAAEANQLASCSILLDLGAKASVMKSHKRYREMPSALHIAAANCNLGMVKALVNHSDINYSILPTPDFEWFWNDSFMLSSCTSRVFSESCWASEYTPLQISLELGWGECVGLLLAHGARLMGGEVIQAVRFHLNLQRILNHGGDANEKCKLGESALQLALRNKLHVSASTLLKAGAKIEDEDVMLALEIGNLTMVEDMGFHDSNVLDLSSNGEDALAAACAGGNYDVIDVILGKCRASFGTKPLLELMLSLVTRKDINLDTVRNLLGRQRTSSDEALNFNNAVVVTAYHNRLDLLKTLLEYQIDGSSSICEIPQQTNSLIHDPHHRSNWIIDHWRSVLRAPDKVYNNGRWDKYRAAILGKCSVLVGAIKADSTEALELLLCYGYKPDTVALQLAIVLGKTATLQRLLDSGVDINSTQGRMDSVLQLAARKDHTDMVKMLIDAGAHVNQAAPWRSNSSGAPRTALQHAVERGNSTTIDMLIAAGANINAPPARISGATALQVAAAPGYLGIVKHLLELDADVDAAGAKLNGRTALEAAAEQGRIDVVGLLLAHGVKTDEGEGQRQFVQALLYAEMNNHGGVASLLRKSRPWTEDDVQIAARLSSKMGQDFFSRLQLEIATQETLAQKHNEILARPLSPDPERDTKTVAVGGIIGEVTEAEDVDDSWMDLVNW